MDRLLRLGGAGMGGGAAPSDAPVVDTAEQVYISSLALLKMLKHGRAGLFYGKGQKHERIFIILTRQRVSEPRRFSAGIYLQTEP